jgi:hypothetical protein
VGRADELQLLRAHAAAGQGDFTWLRSRKTSGRSRDTVRQGRAKLLGLQCGADRLSKGRILLLFAGATAREIESEGGRGLRASLDCLPAAAKEDNMADDMRNV